MITSKPIDIIYISNGNIRILAENVKEHMDKGFVPYGIPLVYRSNLVQVMHKYESMEQISTTNDKEQDKKNKSQKPTAKPKTPAKD